MQVGSITATLAEFVSSGEEATQWTWVLSCGRHWCCHRDGWLQRKVQGPLVTPGNFLSSPRDRMEPTSHPAPGASRT